MLTQAFGEYSGNAVESPVIDASLVEQDWVSTEKVPQGSLEGLNQTGMTEVFEDHPSVYKRAQSYSSPQKSQITYRILPWVHFSSFSCILSFTLHQDAVLSFLQARCASLCSV